MLPPPIPFTHLQSTTLQHRVNSGVIGCPDAKFLFLGAYETKNAQQASKLVLLNQNWSSWSNTLNL